MFFVMFHNNGMSPCWVNLWHVTMDTWSFVLHCLISCRAKRQLYAWPIQVVMWTLLQHYSNMELRKTRWVWERREVLLSLKWCNVSVFPLVLTVPPVKHGSCVLLVPWHLVFLQTKLLLDLCRDGCKADIGSFDELLKHGADPNGRDMVSYTWHTVVMLYHSSAVPL